MLSESNRHRRVSITWSHLGKESQIVKNHRSIRGEFWLHGVVGYTNG